MSAVISQQCITLDLPSTRAMPRRLKVERSPAGRLYISMWGAGKSWHPLASGNAPFDAATLHSKWPTLVIGDAQFWLTESEAAEVERVFGPLGLKIERSELHS